MKVSTKLLIAIFAPIFSLATSSVTLAENIHYTEKELQVRNDLCVLSLFLQMQERCTEDILNGAKGIALQVMPKSDNMDQYYAYGARGQGLAQIYLGAGLYDGMRKHTPYNTCYFPNLSQHDRVDRISQFARSEAEKEIDSTKRWFLASLEAKITHIMHVYANATHTMSKSEKAELYNIVQAKLPSDTAGSNPVPGYEELRTLRNIKDSVRNPLYWEGYFLAFPTTPLGWRWHESSLSDVRDFYNDAMDKIIDGTFKDWWMQ